jgi:hypothetical protein
MAQGCYNIDDHYLPASFRGVPFVATDISSEHGRRGAEGEFPWGETTAYADLGIKIRKFSISGRFDDNDHVERATALIAVAERRGAGILVHPTRGILNVACTSIRIKDNPEEQAGITEFDMEFVESQVQQGFTAFDGALSIVSFVASTIDYLTGGYIINDVRWYLQAGIAAMAGDSFFQLRSAYDLVASITMDENDYRILSDFDAIINDPYVVRDAETAATALRNGFAQIDSRAEAGEQKIGVFKTLMDWPGISSLPGEAGEVENTYLTAFRSLAAAYYAKAVVETIPDNFNQGMAQYDTITNALSAMKAPIYEDCDTPLYWLALNDFQIAAQRSLIYRAYNAPALVQYQFPGSVHSLVAAYEIYGDAKRFSEIEMRNPGYPWGVGPMIIAERS